MTDAIDSAVSRLKRAKEIGLEIRDLMEKQLARGSRFDEEIGLDGKIYGKYYFDAFKIDDIATRCTDIFNQLRAIVDNLFCAYAIKAANITAEKEIRRLQMPIEESQGKLQSEKYYKKMHPTVRGLVDEIEPYKGGKSEFLVDLNDLRRIDFHRALLPLVAGAGGFSSAGGVFKGGIRFLPSFEFDHKSNTITLYIREPNSYISVQKPVLYLELRLAEGSPLPHAALPEVIQVMHNRIGMLIPYFQSKFSALQKSP